MLLVDDLAAGGTKKLRHTPRGLVTLIYGCYTCLWLSNIDMHLYVKFDQNIPCGSRVIRMFTN